MDACETWEDIGRACEDLIARGYFVSLEYRFGAWFCRISTGFFNGAWGSGRCNTAQEALRNAIESIPTA